MKKMIAGFVAIVATFVLSGGAFSTGDNISPKGVQIYCAYDEDYTSCEKREKGDACYLVNEDCEYIN